MQVTMISAGILGLLMVVLGLRVSTVRRAARVSLGDGGNALLGERVRAHGNCTETVPIALILLLLVEGQHGQAWYVVALAVLLVITRILHPIGMARPAPNVPRVAGMVGTWTATGVLALIAIATAFLR